MKKTPAESIRQSIAGADRAMRLPPAKPPPAGTTSDKEPPCPLIALGDAAGVLHFIDPLGQKIETTPAKLAKRLEIEALFRGDLGWLIEKFPERKEVDDGAGGLISRIVGFKVTAAGSWLINHCQSKGLFDETLKLRGPGIWRGRNGPIVHVGDTVLIDDAWHKPGVRSGDQLFVAAAATPRPGISAGNDKGEHLCQEIQRLWKFRLGGAPQLLVGLIATGMLGLNASWRPNGMLIGEGGSGKSTLLDVLRAACPLCAYTNNASEMGVLSLVRGRCLPIFIDESSDRENQRGGGAEALMDIVLASASGDGTRIVRGRADGGFRATEMAGSVLFASVNPPPLQPQHLGRITLFELQKPDAGADHRSQQLALAGWAEQHGAAIWARVIESAERWHEALGVFRGALASAGCAPREMDQMGALLAGWWIATEEGAPDEQDGREAIGLAVAFIRPADAVAEDSGPQRALRHLLGRPVQYDGSTRVEQIGVFIARAWRGEQDDPESLSAPHRVLERHGVRPVKPCHERFEWRSPKDGEPGYRKGNNDPERRRWYPIDGVDAATSTTPCRCLGCCDFMGRPVPRLRAAGGVWLAPSPLAAQFRGAPGLEGGRWERELARLGTWSDRKIRVGGVVGRAIWLGREVIEDEE